MNILRETRGTGGQVNQRSQRFWCRSLTRLITTAVRSSICLVPFAKASHCVVELRDNLFGSQMPRLRERPRSFSRRRTVLRLRSPIRRIHRWPGPPYLRSPDPESQVLPNSSQAEDPAESPERRTPERNRGPMSTQTEAHVRRRSTPLCPLSPEQTAATNVAKLPEGRSSPKYWLMCCIAFTTSSCVSKLDLA